MRYLAIDYGGKRTGLAICDEGEAISSPLQALATGKPQTTFRMTASLAARAKGAVDQMDARGAWVERGSLRQFTGDEGVSRIIDTRTFATNVDVLSRFIAAARRQ